MYFVILKHAGKVNCKSYIIFNCTFGSHTNVMTWLFSSYTTVCGTLKANNWLQHYLPEEIWKLSHRNWTCFTWKWFTIYPSSLFSLRIDRTQIYSLEWFSSFPACSGGLDEGLREEWKKPSILENPTLNRGGGTTCFQFFILPFHPR